MNVSAPTLSHFGNKLHPIRSASAPGGSGRRIAFAQNLSVHTTWPANVYDRRAEPATCNRLTPTLAQVSPFWLRELHAGQGDEKLNLDDLFSSIANQGGAQLVQNGGDGCSSLFAPTYTLLYVALRSEFQCQARADLWPGQSFDPSWTLFTLSFLLLLLVTFSPCVFSLYWLRIDQANLRSFTATSLTPQSKTCQSQGGHSASVYTSLPSRYFLYSSYRRRRSAALYALVFDSFPLSLLHQLARAVFLSQLQHWLEYFPSPPPLCRLHFSRRAVRNLTTNTVADEERAS